MAQKEKGGEHMWQWWTYGCYMDTGWCRGAGPLPIPAVITIDEETTAVGAALHTQPALVVELDQIAVSQNSPFLLYMWGADRFLPFEIGTILHLHPFLLYIWGADRFLPFEIGTRLHLYGGGMSVFSYWLPCPSSSTFSSRREVKISHIYTRYAWYIFTLW